MSNPFPNKISALPPPANAEQKEMLQNVQGILQGMHKLDATYAQTCNQIDTMLRQLADNGAHTRKMSNLTGEMTTKLQSIELEIAELSKTGPDLQIIRKEYGKCRGNQMFSNVRRDNAINAEQDMLSLFWESYSEWQIFWDKITDKIGKIEKPCSSSDKAIKLIQIANAQLIKNIENTLNTEHTQADYACAMAITFNAERHRQRMKQKFALNGVSRKNLF